MTSNKPTRTEIHNLLENINKDLGDFIKNRIQDGILSDKDWSSLFEEPERTWCWETLSCNKEDCPLRKQDGNASRMGRVFSWSIRSTTAGMAESGPRDVG